MAGPMKLPITNMRFDVTMPLFEGRVEIEGAALEPIQTTPMVFADVPALRTGDFGIWDLNMGYLLTAIEAGWEFVALPVFQKRKSVLQFIFVRDGIDSPRDLEGARIGTRQYRTSVTIWARGILAEHFGVDISGITWAAGIDEFFPNHDAGGGIEKIDASASLPDMLINGEIDAMISDISDGALFDRLEAEPKVKRLFADYRSQDLALGTKTGFLPAMHLMVISAKLDRDHPGLAARAYKAFDEAKTLSYEDIRNDRGGLPIVHMREAFDAQMAAWGDPLVGGIAANRAMIETFIRYNVEQGSIEAPIPLERIFAASVLET